DNDIPVIILNIGDVIEKIKNWKLKLPRVTPFYAVKCNDHPLILKMLAAFGTGFDCASKAEIRKILQLGVNPSRIIFAHTCKPFSHIIDAAELGVYTMTFDNEYELYKIQKIFPSTRLVIRIRCDAKEAQCPLGLKFGANPEEVEPLLNKAKELGLNIVGVSFHVGSGCRDPQIYYEAIRKAREVFDKAIGIGYSPYLLDIGGGFPGNVGSSLDQSAEFINKGLRQYFSDENVQVIAEPGRYVVASAFTLFTKIIGKREVKVEGKEKRFMYYLNDGVYGSFNGILFDHQEPKPTLMKADVENRINKLHGSQIWGPTCDSVDKISENELLPEMNIGQFLMWEDMGAYTLVALTGFNGFQGPKVHIVAPLKTPYLVKELSNEMKGNLK
ncbi:Ornithine decarboxylase, partial [Armadillidium nasatum]